MCFMFNYYLFSTLFCNLNFSFQSSISIRIPIYQALQEREGQVQQMQQQMEQMQSQLQQQMEGQIAQVQQQMEGQIGQLNAEKVSYSY